MYGNAPFRDDTTPEALTVQQRKDLHRELCLIAARTRELLPGEFVVGSELTSDLNGPRATLAVEPPIGAIVSAQYEPVGDVDFTDDLRDELAVGLAASAALQVKQSLDTSRLPAAR